MAPAEFHHEGETVSTHRKRKLSRRQFAGTVVTALAAPALLGAALPQEEKKPEAPKPQAAPEEAESWLERGRKTLKEFPVPVETDPAFIFQAGRRK